jgi:transcription initiation factor IIE alpha subunit
MSFGVLNFDMSFDNMPTGDSKKDALISMLKTRFPIDGTCIQIDISLKNAKDFLGELMKEKLSGYVVNMAKPTKSSTYTYVLNYQKAYDNRKYYVDTLANDLLPKRILQIENSFLEKQCRNEIEKKRLEESGEILTKQATTQELNILPSNYKEQYIYIGLGAVVLLVGLYIISKK